VKQQMAKPVMMPLRIAAHRGRVAYDLLAQQELKLDAVKDDSLGDQSQLNRAYRTKAFDYMREHRSRVPVVVAARIARTWGLFRPVDMVGYEINENKERWVSWAGLISYYPVLGAAIAGAVILLRRRKRYALWIACVPLLTTTFVVALASGQVRHRAVAEPSLTILAAVAVAAVAARTRGSGPARVPDQSELA